MTQNTPWGILLACIGLTFGYALPSPPPVDAEEHRSETRRTDGKEAENAIRAVIQQSAAAWKKGDGAAYAAAFTEDADYITYGGTLQKGRREIAATHQQLFDGPLKGTSLQGAIRSVRLLSPNVAVVHCTYGILFPGQKQVTEDRQSVQTFVLVKRNGQWRITASQVTRVLPQTR